MICIQKIYGLNGLNLQFIEPVTKGKWKTGGPGGPYDISGQNGEGV